MYRYELILGGEFTGPVMVNGRAHGQRIELTSTAKLSYEEFKPLLADALDYAARMNPEYDDRQLLGRAIEILTASGGAFGLLETSMSGVDVRGFIEVARKKAEA